MVPELQLERLPAQRQPAQLVPQANSEDRHAPRQLADVLDGVGDGLRIARAIREKHAVRRIAITSSAGVYAGTTTDWQW